MGRRTIRSDPRAEAEGEHEFAMVPVSTHALIQREEISSGLQTEIATLSARIGEIEDERDAALSAERKALEDKVKAYEQAAVDKTTREQLAKTTELGEEVRRRREFIRSALLLGIGAVVSQIATFVPRIVGWLFSLVRSR